jgi:hypothetical protein
MNSPKMQAKVTVVSVQMFDLESGDCILNNQISKPIAITFLIIASMGVIGNNSPKHPQLPTLPLTKVS